VKNRLAALILLAGFAGVATQAVAQSATAQPSRKPAATKAAAKPAKAPADAPRKLVAAAPAAGAVTANVASLSLFTAAGSVVVLADGIVANAAFAQVQPPADGFVYEQ
jgi:hypothetical protein